MGRILKVVIENQYEFHGRQCYLSNGLHPLVADYIKQQTFVEDTFNPHEFQNRIEKANPNWRGNFTLSNFFYYFQKFYGNESIVTLDQMQDDDAVYVYPIEINTTIDSLYEPHRLTFNGKTVEYTLLEILSPRVKRLLEHGQLKLLISNIQDPCTEHSSIRKFEEQILAAGISSSNLIYIFGNLYKNYKNVYPESPVKFTYGILPLQQQAQGVLEFPRQTSLGYVSDIVRREDVINTKNKIRSKKFLSFNRSLRSHRFYLAYLAQSNNMFADSIFSFINVNNNRAEQIKDSIEKFAGKTITTAELDKLMALFPYELDTHDLDENQKRGFTTDCNKKDWYLDSYFHITSETSFDITIEGGAFFSEKTFRPIINLQPFIFVGNVDSLKTLKDLGFKTFHPFINESYDSEFDPVKRMQLITKEILRLNRMPREQLHKLYYKLQPIVAHNFEKFMSYKDTNPFEQAVNDILKFNYD